MNPRGRRIALAALALGVLTLAGAGFAVRGWVVEEWHIWKLYSEVDEERENAANKLGEMGSIKAVYPLLEIYKKDRSKAKSRSFFASRISIGSTRPPWN